MRDHYLIGVSGSARSTGKFQGDRRSSATGCGDRWVGSGSIDAEHVVDWVIEGIVSMVGARIASGGEGGNALRRQFEEDAW